MAKREKVIKGLDCCASGSCMWCTYFREHNCLTTLEKDALELLKRNEETIASLQSTIDKLTKTLAEQPEQKFFVDSDGKMTPLPIQKHGHWVFDPDEPNAAMEEAVAPTISEGAEGEEVICCGSCGTSLYHLYPWIKINKAREFVQYCRHCGREVKWE